MEDKTLTEQATAIIDKKFYNDEDIQELQRIKFHMSLLFEQTNTLWSEIEEKYNLSRPKYYHEAKHEAMERGEKLSETKAESIGKFKAEQEFGNYRSTKESARGMTAIIRAIEGVCVTYHTANKHSHDAEFTANKNTPF